MAKQKSQMQEFVVKLEMPEGVSIAEMKEYIEDSVVSCRGRLPPDPLPGLDRDKIRVIRPRLKRYYINMSFRGHYPVGTAALVQAGSTKKAAELLEKELIEVGLTQSVPATDMEDISTKPKVCILLDGEY